MSLHTSYSILVVVLLSVLPARVSHAQLAPPCVPDSPERRGEVGCSIIENRLLGHLTGSIFWHIDRFDALERARSAAGPAGVAFEAAGTAWLLTVEADIKDHHGGQHVTQIGPLPLPQVPTHAMQVQAAAFTPGMYSVVHHHSGVEAIYVIEGEACYETPTRAHTLGKGETLMIAGGTLHRAAVMGSERRYVFAVIVHDASQPPTMRMSAEAQVELARCR